MRTPTVNLPTFTANSLIDFRFLPLYNLCIQQVSKNVDISEYINYDGNGNIRLHCDNKGGIKIMTDYKTELIRLILENDNIEQAIMTASVIISDLLKQYESPQEQIFVYLQADDQMRSSI